MGTSIHLSRVSTDRQAKRTSRAAYRPQRFALRDPARLPAVICEPLSYDAAASSPRSSASSWSCSASAASLHWAMAPHPKHEHMSNPPFALPPVAPPPSEATPGPLHCAPPPSGPDSPQLCTPEASSHEPSSGSSRQSSVAPIGRPPLQPHAFSPRTTSKLAYRPQRFALSRVS